MTLRYQVKPVNPQFYRERCRALRKCLDHVDVMPAFLVVFNCWSVMHRALGSDWKVLRYVASAIVRNRWSRISERAWWTWHLYIRCRSRGEIQEIIDQQLEDLTGDDHREWPDIVTVEESQEQR